MRHEIQTHVMWKMNDVIGWGSFSYSSSCTLESPTNHVWYPTHRCQASLVLAIAYSNWSKVTFPTNLIESSLDMIRNKNTVRTWIGFLHLGLLKDIGRQCILGTDELQVSNIHTKQITHLHWYSQIFTRRMNRREKEEYVQSCPVRQINKEKNQVQGKNQHQPAFQVQISCRFSGHL